MRKAKIVCTIGPASSSKAIINRMIAAGMDVARLNFSHGTHESHKKAFDTIRSGARRHNSPVAVLQDIKGLKIRTGMIGGGPVYIKEGASLTLTSKNISGDGKQIQVQYPRLVKDLDIGNIVLIDDGLIRLKVTGKEKDGLITRVIEGGLLKEKKGVNFPGVRISAPAFTKKDAADIAFGVRLGIDYIALSFVRSREDILKVKDRLKREKAAVPVIAKIENRQAVENIDDIIDVADGIMVARGDLGVEFPPEEVPMIQKVLIQKCNLAMKPVITATQMLESMTEHSRPTRAEAADVANAVLDGTDALMLSGETAAGKYPVEAVEMMDRIIRFTESNVGAGPAADIVSENFAQAIAEAACSTAMDIRAKTIVAFSRSGFTALLVSKFRPSVPVTGFTETEDVRRRMNLYRGVTPHVMKFPGNTDEMISASEKALLQKGLVKKGDTIAIIATSPFALGGKSNIMKLHRVGIT
ncbi:MAG: pyruvate kinase [Nitrospirae bacterium]|nr:pyruvate kinase [Nitrospirota bacterium]